MTNSEARKRAQQATQATPAIHQRPASADVDPSATETPVGPQIANLDVEAIRAEWLNQCGPCDGGLPMGCSCPDADPRPVIGDLVAALDESRAEVAMVRRGARTLGHIVETQGRDALDASGMHHVIGEDGDGDWAVVWEVLAELRPRAEKAEAELDRLTAALAAEQARVAAVAKVEQRMADCALQAWSSATARHGCSDEEALIQHADTLSRWSERLRQALATTTAAPTTESKEDDHA